MEASERRRNLLAATGILFIVFWSHCNGVEGQRNTTRMSYVCPPEFIRLGHSCYFFSDTKATWQNALYACQDKDSNLTVPARWEDRNLRKYLNNPSHQNKDSRWIGGIYDYNTRAWRWGGELKRMHYQSFSKMKKMTPEDLQLHCIAMMPELLYRWSPRNCIEQRQYICQTKLKKVQMPKLKGLRTRWQRRGTINEIIVPNQDENDPMVNDVTINPVHNPKSYDLNAIRPGQKRHGQRLNGTRNSKSDHKANELKKRSRNAHRRLTRPFAGYQWNRHDPEGSYQRNAEILRSGRTGLSPQQVKAHLARLQHLRDRQIARRKRLRNKEGWLPNDPKAVLAQSHARTYMVDNNISALHPKTIVEEFMIPPPAPVSVPRQKRLSG